MLTRHDYTGLATRFGYARAFDRESAAAIESDFLAAAASPFRVPLGQEQSIAVKYFKPNSTGLFAAVECMVQIAAGAAIDMSLIVTGNGEEKSVTVEDIVGLAE